MYRVTTDEQSQLQIDALPPDALAPFAEARVVLEVDPWVGDSLNDGNPDAPVRSLAFGPAHQGLVITDLGAPQWHEFGLTATPTRHTIWFGSPDGPSWLLPVTVDTAEPSRRTTPATTDR